MQAQAGDRIRVRSHRLGVPDRCGEVVEVRTSGTTATLVVRWDGTDHDVLFFPGTGAVIEHREPSTPTGSDR